MLRYVGFWKNPDNKITDNKITSWTVKLQMDQQKCSKAIWQKYCKWDLRGYPTRIRFQGGFICSKPIAVAFAWKNKWKVLYAYAANEFTQTL